LSAGSTIYAAVFTVVVVVLGVLYFRSHERRFPDVI
jgi:ABC-type polysaccharide/polyol phosphate export permease